MERPAPVTDLPRRRARVRIKQAPAFWALLAAAAFVVSFPTGEIAFWQGFLLAVPFLVCTTGLGWQAATVLAPIALLLVWARGALFGDPAGWTDYVGLLGVMALGAIAGQQIYNLWRASERRARHSERRARLLQQAAVELNQAASEDALFRSAPRLLSDILPFTHAEIFVPEGDHLKVHTTWRWKVLAGFTIPFKTVTGRAFTTGERQYVRDTREDPDFMPAPGAAPTRSELALPLIANGTVRAALNLEHERIDAFGLEVQEVLEAFVRMMEEVLNRLDASSALERNKAEQKLLADLNRRLLLAEGVGEAAGAALEELLQALDIDCGALLSLGHGRLKPLAVRGEFTVGLEARLEQGLPFDGILRQAWESREPQMMDEIPNPVWTASTDARSAAILPIVDASGQVQALLALTRLREARPWTGSDLRVLLSSATSLSAALERATLNRQLLAMLEVIRQLASSEAPAVLYRRAAEAAVELVPGAEALSILVRHGELFHYEAAVGYDLEELQSEAGPFTYQEQLQWYSEGPNGFEAGVARVLRGDIIAEHSGTAQRSPSHIDSGRVTDMRSQIMVPITAVNGVVAILNIDNFSTEDAFGSNAVRVAESFAQHIAVVVRQAEQMVELERSALTDSLTGLGNREGFERVLRQELSRARRYGHHLNLVVVDLNNFKQVNDRFGHAVGDAALVSVADALKASKRGTDSVFRWGGDEFVVLLPEVRPEDARLAMERLMNVVSEISVQGVHLGASIGIASYPTDGVDPESLLRRADGRMYEYKTGHRKPVDGSRRRPRKTRTAADAAPHDVVDS